MSARRYVMTARRKAALRKAQLVSARKRRGRKPQTKARKAAKNAAIVGASAAVLGATAYGSYKGKRVMNRRKVDRSQPTRTVFGPSAAAYVDTMNVLAGQRAAARRGIRPNIPSSPQPTRIDREVFNESSQKTFVSKYGPFRNSWTASERRRRRRLGVHTPFTSRDRQKPISYAEAWRRATAYRETMQRRGVKVNSSHMAMVSQAYQRMKI